MTRLEGGGVRPRSTMGDYPHIDRLESVTVLLPVMNETAALSETVRVIGREVAPELVKEFLIITSEKTTHQARTAIAGLQGEMGERVVVLPQRLPFLGGALRDGFIAARGSHVLIMASDLETDPRLVPAFIAEAQKNPSAIVTASRWLRPGSFHGYSGVKLACNRAFQRCFSLLYGTSLSDLTYGFRLLPKPLLVAIRWEEVGHPLLFETLIKPMRLGVPIVEIPATWRARQEGESQNTFLRNFAYVRIGLKARFAPRRSFYTKCLR